MPADQGTTIEIESWPAALPLVMTRAGLTRSHGAARRLITQGAVQMHHVEPPDGGKHVRDPQAVIGAPGVIWLRSGRRDAVRVELINARTSAEVDDDPLPW